MRDNQFTFNLYIILMLKNLTFFKKNNTVNKICWQYVVLIVSKQFLYYAQK